MNRRTCTACRVEKPASEFGPMKLGKRGLRAQCNECRRAQRNANKDQLNAARRAHYATSDDRRNKQRAASSAYYYANPEKVKEWSRKYHERNRERIKNASAEWYAANKVRVNAYASKARAKLRSDVLAAYGNACECCGEREPRFLAVDHRFGDGAAHRRELGIKVEGKRGRAGNFYQWLKENGYPKDRFRLLCHNCNFASGTKGICPHSLQPPIASDTWQHMGYS